MCNKLMLLDVALRPNPQNVASEKIQARTTAFFVLKS